MYVGIGGRGSRELLDRWNNECSLRMVLLGRFKAVPPILMGKLLVFTVTVRLATVYLFVFLMEFWNEYWSRTSWNATGLAILSKTQPFFLTKCSSNCCKILVNFQSSEKNDFVSFYLCYCFYKRADSQISLFCHSCWCSFHGVLNKLF